MPPRGNLSRTQCTLMAACWHLGTATARTIHNYLVAGGAAHALTTTRTQLDRLVHREWLRLSSAQRPARYSPTLPPADALALADQAHSHLRAVLAPLVPDGD